MQAPPAAATQMLDVHLSGSRHQRRHPGSICKFNSAFFALEGPVPFVYDIARGKAGVMANPGMGSATGPGELRHMLEQQNKPANFDAKKS